MAEAQMGTRLLRPDGPAFACVYGRPGVGKSCDAGYSFAGRAVYVAAPGALEPIKSVCGWDPKDLRREAKTIMDATGLIKVAQDAKLEAIVFDDFSFLAEQTLDVLEKKHTGFKIWGALREATLDFRNAARYANIHVILNAWEQGPGLRSGRFVKGGPKLPSDLPEALPAMCDLVLRAGFEPMRKPWGGTYLCKLDPEWVMKNRFNSTAEVSPMNLGEILRHSGYVIGRHPALPDQEAWVEGIAGAMMKAGVAGDREIGLTAIKTLREKNIGQKVIDWTIRDAVDRVALRRATAAYTSEAAFGWA